MALFRRRTPSPARSISNKSAKNRTPIVFWIFFTSIGAGVSYPLSVKPAYKILSARNWQEIPCVVESSDVESNDDSDGTTYSIKIVYTYQVKGKQYRSDRYHFFGGSSSGYRGKQAVVNRYPPGRKTICYVNPNKPEDAVLNPGFTTECLFGLIPLVFVVVGLGGIISYIRRARSPQTVPAGAEWQAEPDSPTTTAYPDTGPVILKPETSPVGRLIQLAAFAVVWNGIIFGFMVKNLVKDWQSADHDWFLVFFTLFAIPFVAVGVGTVIAVIYRFLAILNPKPELTIASRTVCLGNSMSVQWRLTGRISRIRKLEITFEGREEATYRRGTDTKTDEETFAKIDVFNTTTHALMPIGSARVSVPENTMHSFVSANNKIIWTLRVHGEIRGWPDLDERFRINVLPIDQR